MTGKKILSAGVAAIALCGGNTAIAQSGSSVIEIEAQDLGAALRALARTSGRDVIADADLVAGKRSSRVRRASDPEAALAQMLRETGLRAERVEGAFVIRPGHAGRTTPIDIVVVGTRIRGAAPVGSPVTVIDRETLERAGRGTMQGLFETIPSNFGGGQNEATLGVTTRNGSTENLGLGSAINLRGLGSAATLVLFDGSRPALGGTNGTFADISLIPQLAIERVELLTDGASAIYGTDAVAGVVNFRFRRNYKGFETSLRAGTADGDFSEYQLGQLAGLTWGGGGLIVAYQYSQRGNLPGAQRRFATSDLRPFGGPDNRSLFTAPGTITAANGQIFGIPAGHDGRALTPGQLLPGVQYRRDNQREDDLLPRQASHALYAGVDQDLTDQLSVHGQLFYARRRFTFIQPNGFQEVTRVPVSNAFYVDPIGTRQPVTVTYNYFADIGHEFRIGSVEGLSGVGGATLSLGPWRVEATGSYGDQRTRFRIQNVLNRARLAAALADSDPLTAYNVFGDGADTNPETIARVRGSSTLDVKYRVWNAAVRADGPLADLPSGPVRLALGAEHRDEGINGALTSDTRGLTPTVTNLQPGINQRNVEALYAELLVPLAGRDWSWLPGQLDLSIAGRNEWYSDFGRTFNPKVGLAWEPRAGVKLRGSYGTSFHAPGFGDLFGTGFNAYLPLRLTDPASPSGTTIGIGLFGYADRIGPEKATSWSAGFDLSDWPLPGVTASLTYFDIRYRDRIATATSDVSSFLLRRDLYGPLITDNPDPAAVQALFASPFFSNSLGIQPQDVRVIVNGLTQNLSAVQVRGLDVDIGYRHDFGPSILALRVSGTRLFAIDQQLTSTAPKNNVVGLFGNPVKLRARGSVAWTVGGLDIGGFLNYTDDYRNQTLSPVQRVRSWTTIDARIGYRFGEASPFRGAQIALTATNLFDKAPPFTVTRYFDKTVGYDPEQASPVGRLIAVQLSAQW